MNPVRSDTPRRLFRPLQLSLVSERSDGSFYNAVVSPASQTPARDPAPVHAPLLFREGPFVAATPHPRIGHNKGGCAYRFTTYRDYDYAIQDGLFGVKIHHPLFLEWVGLQNTPTY